MNKNRKDPSVGELVLTGSLWIGAWRWSARLLGIASTIILARLLLPDDFGIVATGMIVVVFFDILVDLGTDKYLIRLSDPEREDYDTAWTLRLIVITAASTAIFISAAPMAVYFGDNRLINVIQLLAVASILRGFTNIGLTMYRRELQFGKIALLGLGQRLVGVTTTITLAFLLQSYWALVFGEIALRVAELVFSYAIHPYRPRFTIKRFSEQWVFSKWIVARNLAAFLQGSSDQFVVAKFFGIEQIGLYSMAGRFAALPTVNLISPMLAPIYSGLAKKKEEPKALARNVLQVIGATWSVMLPAAALMATLSEPLVIAILGAKWQPAILLVAPLVFVAVASMMAEPAITSLTLLGRVKILAVFHWISAIALISIMLIVAQLGDLVQLALARGMLAVVLLFVYFRWALKALAVTWRRLFACVYRTGIATMALVGVTTAISAMAIGAWVTIVLGMIAGGLTYVVVLYGLWRVAGSPDAGEALLIRKAWILLGRCTARPCK